MHAKNRQLAQRGITPGSERTLDNGRSMRPTLKRI